MKILLHLSFVLVLISSCSSIQPMRVQVQRPATITISQNIQMVAVLNRSNPTSKNSIETVLTAEKPKQDSTLSNECIRGLNQLLQTSDRFKIRYCE